MTENPELPLPCGRCYDNVSELMSQEDLENKAQKDHDPVCDAARTALYYKARCEELEKALSEMGDTLQLNTDPLKRPLSPSSPNEPPEA